MMDKTINVNIAGILFQVDEEAFGILRDYLQTINNRLRNVKGGLETIEDIELRIAEIFQSHKGLAGVVSKENVEAMISTIGKPEDFDITGEESEPLPFIAQRKRMYRNPDDSIISGVCGGIGAYLNADPVLFRILFVLFTAFFGVGFFIYLALWITLPSANTDARKKEMYGDASYSSASGNIHRGYRKTSGNIGNAINEVFRAIGRVFYLVLRIFLIIMGVTLVVTAFLFIVTFIMVFIFKYPGAFSSNSGDMNLNYFPDFLSYIVTPEVAPWITVLTTLALVLPMLALIYWGVKMIFWFKANDGIYNLAGLLLWVMIVAALSIILFSEGISFVETAKTSSHQIINHSPDVLYLKAGKKVSDLNYSKELLFKDDGYNVLIDESKKEIYIRPYLKVKKSRDDSFRVELKKRSSGKSEIEARRKTEDLLYNYSINGDTILLDEYFTIPSGRKWSADNVGINIFVPEGTIIKADSESETLFHSHSSYDSGEDFYPSSESDRSWVLTDEGLEEEGEMVTPSR